MNELESYYSQIDKIRRNALWARIHMDTRFTPDDIASEDYLNHLNDKIKNPTRGMLAMREQEKRPLNYPLKYAQNKDLFEKEISETKAATEEFNNLVDKLYPKTKRIRKYIIDHDRVVFDKVKPSKGTKLIRKFLYLIHK